jgi:hypothetical protein
MRDELERLLSLMLPALLMLLALLAWQRLDFP